MANLLIVESPNKVATIKKFLPGWDVDASIGHITELANDGDEGLGFTITDQKVECRYVPRGKRGAEVIKRLKAKAKSADAIYLATDPDREGESISWHLLQQICGKKPYYRVTYTQITEAAIKQAIAHPRKLDMALVEAQFGRQTLDKLLGFKLSPVVWAANAGKSAGRVQSAALHIVCQREREILAFKPTPYWSLQVNYREGFGASYLGAELTASVEVEAATDEASDVRESSQPETKRITSQAEADRIVAIARQHPHRVIEFTGKQTTKTPPPPLTTSALQQVVGVRYGLSAEEVMEVAQELFEGVSLPDGTRHGAITYHRTDSVELSPEACADIQKWLSQHHPTLLTDKATKHKSKSGSQGAHEAIRPVEIKFTPELMKPHLSDRQLKVYTVIWQRAVASQCASAQLNKTRIVTHAGTTFWEARGSLLRSPGYTLIWNDLQEDVQVPQLKQGQNLQADKVFHTAKMTTPPGRYSEAKLVQAMERLGIGRPSTYAAIMQTIKARGYVEVQKKQLVPTPVGMANNQCLLKAFPAVCDLKFTAAMESALDAIAEGKLDWQRYLIEFNFKMLVPALKQLPTANRPEQAPTVKTEFRCQTCGELLEKFSYSKEGQAKFGLRCSNPKAKESKPHQEKSTYFQSSKGGFWNFTLKAEPTAQFTGGSAAKSAAPKSAPGTLGSGSSAQSRSTKTKPKN